MLNIQQASKLEKLSKEERRVLSKSFLSQEWKFSCHNYRFQLRYTSIKYCNRVSYLITVTMLLHSQIYVNTRYIFTNK